MPSSEQSSALGRRNQFVNRLDGMKEQLDEAENEEDEYEDDFEASPDKS